MPSSSHNKEPVWYYPREGKDDAVCSVIRDTRQLHHWEVELLSAHPEADTNEIYAGLVLLHREPYGDRTGTAGDLSKDWFGPRHLADQVISLQESGGTYQSSLLYPKGTTPPTEDTRVPLLGIEKVTATFTWAWVTDPDSGLPGVDLVELTIFNIGAFTGNEVYIDLTDLGSMEAIDGISPGIFKIARHIDVGTVQIEVPYDADVSPTTAAFGTAYEAQYLLDGFSDSENAPGVLNGLFYSRSFNYRLATPSVTRPWDDSLGLQLERENRLVPATWARLWESGFPLAGYGTEETSLAYQSVSRLISNRQTSTILGTPERDGVEWGSNTKINIPPILVDFNISSCWAWVDEPAEDFWLYTIDWTIDQNLYGPVQTSVETRILRRVVKLDQIDAVIAIEKINNGVTELFSFKPQSYSVTLGWFAYQNGGNRWVRARVQNFRIGPCLLKESPMSNTGYIVDPAPNVGSGQFVIQAGDVVQLNSLEQPPWGTEVLWDIQIKESRFGYFIVDFIFMTLPANPIV